MRSGSSGWTPTAKKGELLREKKPIRWTTHRPRVGGIEDDKEEDRRQGKDIPWAKAHGGAGAEGRRRGRRGADGRRQGSGVGTQGNHSEGAGEGGGQVPGRAGKGH